jgi:CRISPR/Cas system CMR-associated protein Cmr1 (group 7 of RAMP superfamily)
MQTKQKLLGARSQQQRKRRVSSAKISGRTALKGRVDGDSQLSPEWMRKLKRRVKDSRDPVRYMLVSEFSRKFILYYDVSTDTFAMNEASRGTLFKRREVAEIVKTHLGKSIAWVQFTVKGNKLTRLSPFRGMRLRSPSASRIRRRIGHAYITHK